MASHIDILAYDVGMKNIYISSGDLLSSPDSKVYNDMTIYCRQQCIFKLPWSPVIIQRQLLLTCYLLKIAMCPTVIIPHRVICAILFYAIGSANLWCINLLIITVMHGCKFMSNSNATKKIPLSVSYCIYNGKPHRNLKLMTYVVWSSKISLKSVIFNFEFLIGL